MGGTALHWAAFYGSLMAVNFLLAWNIFDINRPDLEGLTPLHLGVMSGNPKVVMKLLLKGANKTVVNFKHQKPLDLAISLKNVSIEEML